MSLAQVITSLTGDGVSANCPTQFGGYAASGDSVRGAIETLTAVVPVRVQDEGSSLRIAELGGAALAIDETALGARTGGGKSQRLTVARQSASTLTETLVLAYYDVARDYQQGMQRARRDGGVRKEDRINLPVTLQAADARALVERRLDTIWSERVTAKLQLPWRYLALRPGDDVSVAGHDATWRISAIKFNKMVLECDLVRTLPLVAVDQQASPGRNVVQLDVPAGVTQLHLLDLPLLTDGVATQPIVGVAAAGSSVGWRQAVLTQSIDGGASWQAAGQTAAAAVMGSAVSVLATGSSALIDEINSIDVQLLNESMQLNDASDTLLLGGANLAMLGSELFQFGRSAPLGANVWRLSRLWRGRRGTEGSIANHQVGEAFILINTTTLASLAVPVGTSDLRIDAQGVGDAAPLPEARLAQPGLALRPLSPVVLTSVRQSNGDRLFSWVRRSRNGWTWADGVDAPLAEESEAYAINIVLSVGATRAAQVTTPQWTYSAAARATDVAAGATQITVNVTQIGTMASSPLTSLILSLV